MNPIAETYLFRRSFALAGALLLSLLNVGTAFSADVAGTAALLNFWEDETQTPAPPSPFFINSPDVNGHYWNNIWGGYWNNGSGLDNIINGAGATLPSGDYTTSVALTNTANGYNGWSLSISNWAGNGINNNTREGSSSTPYSNNLTAIWPLAALEDGFQVKGLGASVILSGLTATNTYTVLLYGCDIGDTGYDAAQTNTLTTYGNFTGTTTVVFPQVAANTNTFAEWDNITPTAGGQIIIHINESLNGGALNCMLVSNTTAASSSTLATKLVITSSPMSTAAGVASSTITVQRQQANGTPVTSDPAISVALTSTSTGTVTFNPASPLTLANGSSSATFTYADTQAGTPTITAANSGLTSAMQQENVTAAAAATVTKTSGDNQSGSTNSALASAFTVTVTDTYGNPVSGTNVTFAIATYPLGATGQLLSATTVATAGNGTAACTLTLGNLTGIYTVTATVGSLTPVTFTATATATTQPVGGSTTALVNFTDNSGSDNVPSPDGSGNYWNNVTASGAGYQVPLSLNGSYAPIALVTTNNGSPGWTLAVTNLPGGYNNWHANAVGYDYAGPYPSAVSSFPSAALMSAMGVGQTGVSVTLGGLNPGSTYSVLLYGGNSTSTANGGSGGFQTDTLTVGTSTSPSAVDFNSFTNATTVVAWNNITPNAGGQITFTVVPDASNPGGDVNFIQVSKTGSAGPAATVAITSGNNQTNIPGAALNSPFTVTVTDATNHPVSGTNVTFAIASYPNGATGQSLSATTVTTAGDGTASSTLTLGNLAGTYTVTATVGSLPAAVFTATAVTVLTPMVQITSRLNGNTLNLTWPSGQGLMLVCQTNSRSTGLNETGNWTTVSGATDGSYSVTLDPAQPAVFYRLVNSSLATFISTIGPAELANLTNRLNALNADIADYGMVQFQVQGVTNFLLTGYSYIEFYDWDDYFENLYQSYYGNSEFCFNNFKAFMSLEQANGFVPRSFGTKNYGQYEPFKPFLAQIAVLGSRQTNDYEWLRGSYYAGLTNFIAYWLSTAANSNGLPVWESADAAGTDNQISRAGAYGAFICEGTDLACYLYSDLQSMALIAQKLGYSTDQARFLNQAAALSNAVNSVLWDDTDGFYYDRNRSTGQQIRVKSVAGFMPLWAGIASPAQALRLVNDHLLNTNEFWLAYPIATYAATEPDFYEGSKGGEDNWCGPAWIPTDYMVMHGLLRYGFTDAARTLAYRTFQMALDVNPVTREYYDSDSGDGQGLNPFWGWSALAYVMPIEVETGYNPMDITTPIQPWLSRNLGIVQPVSPNAP
jgi:hypothetical protein